MQAVVHSLLANYQSKGKGKTVLLLHGWGDSARGLSALQNKLAENYNVVAVDLPGFGGTQAPDEPWGLNEYADFVKSFIQKIGLKVDVLAGHSNGGAIAIRAVSRGVKADKLILIASAGIRNEYKGRMKALRLATKTGKLLTKPLPKSIQKRLRRKVYTTVGSDMLVAEHLQETFKKVVNDDVRDDAAKIKLPTLLLYGDKDISTPLKYGQLLHLAIKGSTLITVQNGEHGLPVERTDEVAEYIEEFLK